MQVCEMQTYHTDAKCKDFFNQGANASLFNQGANASLFNQEGAIIHTCTRRTRLLENSIHMEGMGFQYYKQTLTRNSRFHTSD